MVRLKIIKKSVFAHKTDKVGIIRWIISYDIKRYQNSNYYLFRLFFINYTNQLRLHQKIFLSF